MGNITSSAILCSACHTPLTEKSSVAAGMGRVCRERTHFAESCSRDELTAFEGVPESKGNKYPSFKTGIVCLEGEDNHRLVTTIKRTPDAISFFDRTEANNLFKKGLAWSEAVRRSFFSVKTTQCVSVSSLSLPDDESLKNKFKDFQVKYREETRSRPTDSGTGFISVKSEKNLDKEKQEARKTLIKNLKSQNNEKVKAKWFSGELSLATIMSRLFSSDVPGAKELYEAIKLQNSNIKPQDHGLTDNEITNGLQSSNKSLEKRLFSSVISGRSDLGDLSSLYRQIKSTSNQDAFKQFLEITR